MNLTERIVESPERGALLKGVPAYQTPKGKDQFLIRTMDSENATSPQDTAEQKNDPEQLFQNFENYYTVTFENDVPPPATHISRRLEDCFEREVEPLALALERCGVEESSSSQPRGETDDYRFVEEEHKYRFRRRGEEQQEEEEQSNFQLVPEDHWGYQTIRKLQQ